MSKPIWTTGKILWTENYDDPESETFAKAWLRIFGEEIPYWNDAKIEQVFCDDVRFLRLPKGRVICFTIHGGNIQLDPTYNKNMFKNIQLDPSITYTDSLYVFLFGSLDQGQKCDEFDSVLIKYLREIEAIGVKVYLKDFSRNCKFQYQTIGTSDDCKRVDALMDNCASKLKEITNRSKFQQMFNTVKNWLSGSFNNPSLQEADKMPLILPEKKMKSVISEDKITEASNDSRIKPLIPVRTRGIRAWFRGSFNNPRI